MGTRENKELEKFEELLSKYNFPDHIVDDVRYRVGTNDSENYVAQQNRYLKRVIESGMATEK